MSEELKACPNPECPDNTDLAACSNAIGVRVQCMSCGVMGPFVSGDNEPEATRLWNLIALPRAPLQEEVGRLRESLNGCLEHMEWSTPQGRAACEAARAILDQSDEG